MGLASKIQASGRPAAGGAAAPPPQQQQQQQQQQQRPPTQSAYGQPSYGQPVPGNPPYPTQQPAGQSSYGSANPAMNNSNKPGAQGYGAGQGGAQGAPQSQYGAPAQFNAQPQSGYGQQPPQAGYGQQPPQAGGFGQPAPYGAPAQPAYGQQQQPGAHGQMPPQQGGAGQSGSVIRDNLTRIVRENQLEVFYPQQKLQQVIAKVESINFQSLSTAWDIPMEIATDLAALALYDIVFYCDDSGSMRAEERGERIDDLKLILSRVCEVATMFDDDGIQIRFMNSDVQGNGVRSAQQAQQLVEQVRFSGITPLGTNLDRKVIQPLVIQPMRARTLQKPVLICVITDGEPVGEPRDLTRRVIAGSAQQTAQAGIPGALRFQFAQVGKDMKAQAFLGELDNDPQLGSVIDATSYFELEAMEMEKKGVTLTPDLWLVKLCVGAIDKSYDEQDE